jgi:hypothetical protein
MGISQRELEAARTARAVRTARADARASELAGTIKDIQPDDAAAAQQLAVDLGAREITMACGGKGTIAPLGVWYRCHRSTSSGLLSRL